jgi:uncharacterized protein YpmB
VRVSERSADMSNLKQKKILKTITKTLLKSILLFASIITVVLIALIVSYNYTYIKLMPEYSDVQYKESGYRHDGC